MKTFAKNGRARLSVLVFMVLLGFVCTNAQTLKADYQFDGSLNSSVGTAPALTNLVGAGNGANTFVTDTVDGFQRTTLRFPSNNGVALNSLTGLVPSTSFTLVMLVKLDQLSGQRRWIDVTGGTDCCNGVVLADGRFVFNGNEPTTTLAPIPNTYVQLVLVRSSATGPLSLYREGVLRHTGADDGTPLNAGLRFFQDWSGANPALTSAGNVARIRLYDGPMTADQIRLLDRAPSTPFGPMPILFTALRSGTNQLFRMNTDGSSQTRIQVDTKQDLNARFSPDGQKIVYHSRDNVAGTYPNIWISNTDGSNPVRLTNINSPDQNPVWRPDGQKILFSRCSTSSICDLYTMNPDGTGIAPVGGNANTAGDEDQARFTPDGSKIVFSCGTSAGNDYNICIANSDGTNRQNLTNTVSPTYNVQADVSPDGTKIAFVRGVTGSTPQEIYSMTINGGSVTNLTNTAAADTNPIWSPDGTKILFASPRGGTSAPDLFVMNSDGSSQANLTPNSSTEIPSDWYRPSQRRTKFDFDGDQKSDISVFRPSNGQWWLNRSSSGVIALTFGISTDTVVPAEFTGDGKADLAVWRSGEWFVLRSEDFTFYSFPFGTAGDTPVPADYDGDGKDDSAVFRPSNSTWYIQRSSGGTTIQSFGASTDRPVPADYDGDGKADIAIFRPSLGQWWLNRSTAGLIVHTFGNSGDRNVPGDYTGDGKADVAIWRPSTGEWFVLRSEDSSFYSFPFGATGDVPVPGDYDGDGRTDAGVFRPSNATWYLNRSTSGVLIQNFGLATDVPVPSVFVR